MCQNRDQCRDDPPDGANAYEERQERRRERLLAKASRLERESKSRLSHVHTMAEGMNGQPILIGHHSEKRHRRDVERMDNHMRKAIAADDRAADLRRKAEKIGSGGISSDDPEAVRKLLAKLAGLEAERESMKNLNAVWRKAGKPAPDNREGWKKVADALGVAEEDVAPFRINMAKSFWDAQPIPRFKLTNIGGRIKHTKERIAQLTATNRTSGPIEIGEWTVEEDREANRILLTSPTKPPDAHRAILKRHGFRWSPNRGAWVRQLNNNARSMARYVLGQITKEVTP